MALFGPRRGCSSAASCSQSFSASGSLAKVLLQDQLGGDRIDRLLLYAAQPALGLDRAEALVDPCHRETKAPFELPREALDAPRERMLAVRRDRQADHQLPGLPLLHQPPDGIESGRGDRRQRVGGAELRLPD